MPQIIYVPIIYEHHIWDHIIVHVDVCVCVGGCVSVSDCVYVCVDVSLESVSGFVFVSCLLLCLCQCMFLFGLVFVL